MLDVDVLDDPAAAAVALDPIRSQLLALLGEPASAAILATKTGLARQKVNYHLKALEEHGLVKLAEQRRWGGLTERLYVASASSYVVSPAALGPAAVDPGRARDRFSASYLIALAARAVREVGALWQRAVREDKRLATLSFDADITFASGEARAAFTEDLQRAITDVVARHHTASAPRGRTYRLVVFAHPAPATKGTDADQK